MEILSANGAIEVKSWQDEDKVVPLSHLDILWGLRANWGEHLEIS
jgi:hypothetical protein